MRTRHALGWMLVGLTSLMMPAVARAQTAVAGFDPYRAGGYYAAPGNYAMAHGSASFGVPRTSTSFTSPYGMGYGYGYEPARLLRGPHGVGLWRPGSGIPSYAFGGSNYWTFPVPYASASTRPAPPSVGWYAPGLGPPSRSSYEGW